MFDRIIFAKHLEEDEKILFSVHKHWIEILRPSLEVSFFGLLLPWVLYLIGFNAPLFLYIAIFWSVIAYFRFLYILTDWYSDTWLITNMSVICIEWNGLFSNNSNRISFNDIEGASYEIRGFLGTILRFGNMEIRVMSGSHSQLNNVANPKKAELAIVKYQEKFISERNMQEANHLKALIANLVANQPQ